MANFFTNSIDVTPGVAGSWQDVDVSAYVPTDATGVIIQAYNSGATNYALGLRKKGSTDNRTQDLPGSRQTWGYTGLDASRVFQAYIGSTAFKLKLLGYFTVENTWAVSVSLYPPRASILA